MRVFIEYSENNIKALTDAHKDIVEREEEEQNIICFQEAQDQPLACESLLALDLATYIDAINKNTALYDQCKAALVGDKPYDVLLALVSATDALLTLSGDVVDNLFASLVVLLATVSDEERKPLVHQLIEKLSNSDANILLRTKLFSLLFNNLGKEDPSRFDVYDALVVYLGKINKIKCLKSQFCQLDEWSVEWGISMDEKRQLYKHFFEAAELCNDGDMATDFMIKYLESFDKEELSVLDGAKDVAKSCVVAALKVEGLFQMDTLLDFDVVKNLKGDSAYELLNIFVNEDVGVYNKFVEGKESTIKELGLCPDANLKKMRLLTLASLSSGKNEVSYSSIEAALNIEQKEVETWILEAISCKLIEGKLDQINQRLLVRRSMYRSFPDSRWQEIYDKLNSWNVNVSQIIEVVQG